MAIVKNPLMSAWASGSIGKTLTFRPRNKDHSFTVARFYPEVHKRNPNQNIGVRVLMWKMERDRTFRRQFLDEKRPLLVVS